MFTVVRTKVFERDLKHYLSKGGDTEKVRAIFKHLQQGSSLPPWLRDHQLQGKLRAYREMHVDHDWLLVYEKNSKQLRIVCLWLVSHKKLRERERSL